MSTVYRNWAAGAGFIRREYDRSAVALPAIVTLGGKDYGARVLNIAPGGAMIECSAALPPAASFFLRCGSIAADAVVVWEKSGRYGLNFRLPLTEQQVTEQLCRSAAVNSRKGCLDSPRGGSPMSKDCASMSDKRNDPALRAHRSEIETTHHEVESCLVVMETIMAGELSDLGQFGAARLRLRQANLRRTHAALEACRHLTTTQQGHQDLRDLQRSELDVSQMISDHVQHWTMQALQSDWSGYCLATRYVLKSVRELIAAEKRVLCPLLRGGGQSSGPLERYTCSDAVAEQISTFRRAQ